MPTRLQTYEELAADPEPLAACDLLINATPLGMHPHEEAMPPIPASALRPGMVVYDLIYRPARTRLLQAAEAAGATAVGGLGMLVHQGAAPSSSGRGCPRLRRLCGMRPRKRFVITSFFRK